MSRVVVLNSGGFDSITLINLVHKMWGDLEIHSLHFLYGARNTKQQEECVDRVCKKIGAVNVKIPLPPFTWTTGEFYKPGYDDKTQYVEYRNMVFLSYALSYAQAVGAKQIFLATLKSDYVDCSKKFLHHMNSIAKMSGIYIEAPFSDCKFKLSLAEYAKSCGVKKGDYFSCDNPLEDGRPCGTCVDCVSLKEVEKYL